MWRIASLITVGYTVPCGWLFAYFDYVYFGRGRYSRRHVGGIEKRIDKLWRTFGFRDLSPAPLTLMQTKRLTEKPWSVYLPTTALVSISMICAVYCLARAYIVVEDFVGLRGMPNDVFETVPWTNYLPQIL